MKWLINHIIKKEVLLGANLEPNLSYKVKLLIYGGESKYSEAFIF